MGDLTRVTTLPDSADKSDFHNLVDTATITAGAVGTDELANAGVTEAKLASSSVTNAKLGGDAVDGTKIADDAIDSEHIADGAVDNVHLATINTAGKVDGAAITGLANIPSGAGNIPAANLGNAAVPGDWTDYSSTSTVVGWAASPTVSIYYKTIGSLVFVSFSISGTSNSTTTTFTLPYAIGSGSYNFCIRAVDNTSSAAIGFASIAGSTVTLAKNASGVAFTGSGDKSVNGQFFYEKAA